MKTIKLILITAIALLFLSCSNDDNEQYTYTCNALVKPDGQIRTVIPVQLDCETNEPINLPEGYTFLCCDNDDIP